VRAIQKMRLHILWDRMGDVEDTPRLVGQPVMKGLQDMLGDPCLMFPTSSMTTSATFFTYERDCQAREMPSHFSGVQMMMSAASRARRSGV
jgi:hypothetical protein